MSVGKSSLLSSLVRIKMKTLFKLSKPQQHNSNNFINNWFSVRDFYLSSEGIVWHSTLLYLTFIIPPNAVHATRSEYAVLFGLSELGLEFNFQNNENKRTARKELLDFSNYIAPNTAVTATTVSLSAVT